MKMNSKTAFTIFAAVIMVSSVAGFAMNMPQSEEKQGPGVELLSKYDYMLSGQEKRIIILGYGRALIEHLHLGSEADNNRTRLYEDFLTRFGDVVVLEDVVIEDGNQTFDQIIFPPNGDVVELANITSVENLTDTFCEKSMVQPMDCILRSI